MMKVFFLISRCVGASNGKYVYNVKVFTYIYIIYIYVYIYILEDPRHAFHGLHRPGSLCGISVPMSQNEANDELVIDDGVPVGDLRPHAGFLSIPFLLSVREAIEYPGNMIHIYIYICTYLPYCGYCRKSSSSNRPKP